MVIENEMLREQVQNLYLEINESRSLNQNMEYQVGSLQQEVQEKANEIERLRILEVNIAKQTSQTNNQYTFTIEQLNGRITQQDLMIVELRNVVEAQRLEKVKADQ